MREEDDIVERDQLGRDVRLVGEDVEAGGADRPPLQGLDQRSLVDDAAAADVDQDAVRAEVGEDVARRSRFFVSAVPGMTTTRRSTAFAMARRSGKWR